MKGVRASGQASATGAGVRSQLRGYRAEEGHTAFTGATDHPDRPEADPGNAKGSRHSLIHRGPLMALAEHMPTL